MQKFKFPTFTLGDCCPQCGAKTERYPKGDFKAFRRISYPKPTKPGSELLTLFRDKRLRKCLEGDGENAIMPCCVAPGDSEQVSP